jgi:hypothetical protein
MKEIEAFMKARGLMPLTGHKASKNTVRDPAGFEVGLLTVEAATNLKNCKIRLKLFHQKYHQK